MSKLICTLRIRLLSDAVFSSEISIPGGEDIVFLTDPSGCPIIQGSTVKGLLRESVQNLLCWCGNEDSACMDALFGDGNDYFESEHRVVFGDLRANVDVSKPEKWSNTRTYIKVSEQKMEKSSLRMISCVNMGTVFTGKLFCHAEDFELLSQGCRAVHWAGLHRNRGMGHIRMELTAEREMERIAPVKLMPCIRYRLAVESPLTVSWTKRSEQNNMESRRYLPGSAIRGMVLSRLSNEKPEFFAANRDALLNHTYFHNAFPQVDGHSQFPTPMGFYSDRNTGSSYHVLTQAVKAGDKRSKVGQFCWIEGDELIHSSPQMTVITCAKRQNKKGGRVFSKQAIAAGTVLEGSIYLEDEGLLSEIVESFEEYITLGTARFTGNGVCRVLEVESIPSLPSEFLADDVVPRELYMLIVSPMTMMRNAEPVGICEEMLARALGVDSVEVIGCTTSVTESAGYNRKTKCAEPIAVMYEMGSLFKLRCAPCAPTVEKLHKLEHTGIGIRCSEGYGQVRFLKDFTKKTIKAYESDMSSTNIAAVHRRARTKWLLEHANDVALKTNTLNNLQQLCDAIILDQKAVEEIERFFWRPKEVYIKDRLSGVGTVRVRESEGDWLSSIEEKYQFPEFVKEKRKNQNDNLQLAGEALRHIWENPLSVTLDCDGYPDSVKERFRLLRDWCQLSLMPKRYSYGERDNAGNI